MHLHSAKAGLAGRLLLRGRVPTVFQPHAWSFEAVTGPVHAATLGWERAAARWTSLLVCVSAAERQTGLDQGIRAAAVVVPNGVDLTRLTPAGRPERAAARAALGLDPEAPTAVCVGRLARQKGQDVLLQAWPRVRAGVPDATLVLIGDGPDRAALERSLPAGVSLVGDSDDVASWLAAADVVVVPSRWEGMALVPLEAMARARSVVASDVTGVRESVPTTAGAIVPPGDAGSLAAAVLERLDGTVEADAEGRRGRANVESGHDLALTTARITAAALDLLAPDRVLPAG